LVPPQRTAGPKPIVQVIGAKLGVSMDISLRVPSLAYRLCMAARGVVDFAIASENADDWDIAAADCLLLARASPTQWANSYCTTRNLCGGALCSPHPKRCASLA